MNDITIKNGKIPASVATAIISLNDSIKCLTEELDALKAKLVEEMEKNNIVKIETDELLITYIAATTRETLDGRALRKEIPSICDKFTTITTLKPSVRIKVK